MRGLTRHGSAGRGFDAAEVDLGNEPPLSIGEKTEEAPIRRSISVRWLTGTILTGFTSIFLMGGALMAALNNPNQFAVLPDVADSAVGETGDPGLQFGQKGDRMRPIEEVSSRQILQVSTVTRQGERDFIKLRPFAKVTATLGVPKPEIAGKIPAYDALTIFADNSPPDPPAGTRRATPADDQFYGANVDGEVSVKVTDFPLDTADVDGGAGFDTATVEQVVRAAANFAPRPARMATRSPPSPMSTRPASTRTASTIPSPRSASASCRRTSPTSPRATPATSPSMASRRRSSPSPRARASGSSFRRTTSTTTTPTKSSPPSPT